MLGLNDGDVFGSVIRNISSVRHSASVSRMQQCNELESLLSNNFDFNASLGASATHAPNPSSGIEPPLLEDIMGSFFDFSQFPSTQGSRFEGSP